MGAMSSNSGYDGEAKLLRWLEKKEEGDRTNTDYLGHFTVSREVKALWVKSEYPERYSLGAY